MAGEVRATLVFNSTNYLRPVGWSETVWHRTAGLELGLAINLAEILAVRRASLLGDGVAIKYIRVSREGVYRDSYVSSRNFTAGNSSKVKDATQADYAQLSQLIRMESTAKNRRFSYLGGVPDDLQITNGKITSAAWLRAFQDWAHELSTTWAYYGLVKDALTNRAPPRVVNPTPPPAYLPRPMQLYPFTDVTLSGPASRRRGRPFGLYRGRSARL